MSDGTGIGGCRFSLGYTWSPGGTIKPGFSKPSSILRKFLRYLSHKICSNVDLVKGTKLRLSTLIFVYNKNLQRANFYISRDLRTSKNPKSFYVNYFTINHEYNLSLSLVTQMDCQSVKNIESFY